MYNFLNLSLDDIDKLKAPYNMDKEKREWLIYDSLALYNNAWTLGGTLLRVARSSGYLSAIFNYFGKITDQYKDALMAFESYVVLDDGCDKLDRIFLVPPKWSDEEKDILMGMGRSVDGLACLTKDDLCRLGKMGYTCIYDQYNVSEETVTRFFIYESAFGKNKKMVDFKDACYSYGPGGVFNPALYIDNGDLVRIIMPDIFAIKAAFGVCKAESYIRRYYDPKFFIERIAIDKNKEEVEGLLKEQFNYLWMEKFNIGKLPDGYEDMLYQTAYIKRMYPKVYEKIWLSDYQPEYCPDFMMNPAVIFECETGSVGISIGEYASYVMVMNENGEFRKIPGNVLPLEADYVRYEFSGIGDLYNAGVAYSEAAINFSDIRENVEYITGCEIEKIHAAITQQIPSRNDIYYFMYGPESKKRTQLQRICYDEIKDKNLDGYGVISEAARLVNMPDTKVRINPGMAIIAAIDAETKVPIKIGELALVVYIEYDSYSLYLCTKDMEGLGYFVYAFGEKSYQDNRYVLRDILKKKARDEVKRTYIDEEFSENELQGESDMWYMNYPRLERQFTRCDTAVFEFQEGVYHVQPKLDIKDFNKYLGKIAADIRDSAENMLRNENGKLDRDYSFDDIDRVYLAGNMSDYPYYREAFRSMCNAAVYVSGDPDTVVARGAVLLDSDL